MNEKGYRTKALYYKCILETPAQLVTRVIWYLKRCIFRIRHTVQGKYSKDIYSYAYLYWIKLTYHRPSIVIICIASYAILQLFCSKFPSMLFYFKRYVKSDETKLFPYWKKNQILNSLQIPRQIFLCSFFKQFWKIFELSLIN